MLSFGMSLSALFLQAAAPAPIPDRDDSIVVVARKLKDWRARFWTENGKFHCRTTRSSGDAEIDAIGCTAAGTCFSRFQPRLLAAESRELDRSTRRKMKQSVIGEMGACHRAEQALLTEAWAQRRFEAAQASRP